MLDVALAHQIDLRRKLSTLLGTAADTASSPVDVVVTPNEMNEQHGTGSLVRRLFAGRKGIVSIRARNDYDGDHLLGDEALVLSHGGSSRAAVFERVLGAMRGRRVRRVICAPYIPDDLLTSVALVDAFEARLCIWLMDDQNVFANGIPDRLMREALERAVLRLATHPEIRQAYEQKFRLRFDLLPAVVPAALVRHRAVELPTHTPARAALVGNVWSRTWLDRLCAIASETGTLVDWYGNHRQPALRLTSAELERVQRSGITAHGIFPEAMLAQRLAEHAYAVIPTGMLSEEGCEGAMAHLSLPGRILFIAATSNTPVIVLGDEHTSAARFVRRFEIGTSCPYDSNAFRRAVEQLTAPETQRACRRRAAAIAGALSSEGVTEWLLQSIDRGEPVDDRFEALLPRREEDRVPYTEAPIPADVPADFADAYRALRHLCTRGFRPDFVLDVGASTGIWSWVASKLFPQARFVLIDPITSSYSSSAREGLLKGMRHVEVIEVGVSNASGKTMLHVPPGDLYGSSLFELDDGRAHEAVEVRVCTLDEIDEARQFEGRGLLKVDVQFAEHLVLEGATKLFDRLDAVVLELSLERCHPDSRTLLEMCNALDRQGFAYFDDAGCWRSPADGTLIQKDVLFVRRGVAGTCRVLQGRTEKLVG